MSGWWSRPALAIDAVATLVLLGVVLLMPLDIRHSAPFGFNQTLDRERGIAVRGGMVTPNYDNFNRVDLDLRAYTAGVRYDLTVHIRPDEPGAADLRRIHLGLDADDIWHVKPAFDDPFTTVRFAPIADSAGRHYYVWVEPGVRNRDHVLNLWSIKSYSRATGRDVIAAVLDDPPGNRDPDLTRLALVVLFVGTVAAFGALAAALVAAVTARFRRVERPVSHAGSRP